MKNHKEASSKDKDYSALQEHLPAVTELTKLVVQFQLQSRYKTRYGAWIGIGLIFFASLASVIWRGGAVEWLLLSVTSFLILYSGFAPYLAASKLIYSRVLSAQFSEDGEMVLQSTLMRKFCIPGMWYVIHEQYHNQSQLNKSPLAYRASFSPLFHRTMVIDYSLKHIERGRYAALPTEIIVGDWLGLTSIALKRDCPQHFVSLPTDQVPSEDSYVANNGANRWKEDRISDSLNSPTQASLTSSIDDSNQSMHLNGDGELLPNQGVTSFISEQTRPYLDGDNYRRVDIRALARGRGLQTRLSEEQLAPPRHCIIIDQFALPYQDTLRNQLFESQINWAVAEVHEQSDSGTIFVITDDWSFEYSGEQHSYELRCLLALTRADVQQRMKERLPHLSILIPANSHVTVFTGDWRENEGWLALAELTWLKGCTLDIHFVTSNRVLSYAMREQQKILEQAGIRAIWRYSKADSDQLVNVIEGSERYATS